MWTSLETTDRQRRGLDWTDNSDLQACVRAECDVAEKLLGRVSREQLGITDDSIIASGGEHVVFSSKKPEFMGRVIKITRPMHSFFGNRPDVNYAGYHLSCFGKEAGQPYLCMAV